MEKIYVDHVGPGGREVISVADEVPASAEVVSAEETPKNKRRKKNA